MDLRSRLGGEETRGRQEREDEDGWGGGRKGTEASRGAERKNTYKKKGKRKRAVRRPRFMMGSGPPGHGE